MTELPKHIKEHYGEDFVRRATNPPVTAEDIGRTGLLRLSVDESCCVVLTVEIPDGFGIYRDFDVTVTDVTTLITLLRSAQDTAQAKFEEATA